MHRIQLFNQDLLLLPEKAIFWENESMLILSDLHLGKAGHFRKHGIGVTQDVHLKDLSILKSLIKRFDPKTVLFLGDLFHSRFNLEWQLFVDWKKTVDADFILVKGNHDKLHERYYLDAGLHLFEYYFQQGPFIFSHEPFDFLPPHAFAFSGHIHPAVSLSGRANQHVRLECFLFSGAQALLPAFGTFTGSAVIKPLKQDKVFVIAGEQVIDIDEV